MAAKRLDRQTGLTLSMQPSSDGESYVFGIDFGGAFIPLTDVKAGRVDFALDEELQRRQEQAAAEQAKIAPEPGAIASVDPGAAPPGVPGDEPTPAPATPAEQPTETPAEQPTPAPAEQPTQQ